MPSRHLQNLIEKIRPSTVITAVIETTGKKFMDGDLFWSAGSVLYGFSTVLGFLPASIQFCFAIIRQMVMLLFRTLITFGLVSLLVTSWTISVCNWLLRGYDVPFQLPSLSTILLAGILLVTITIGTLYRQKLLSSLPTLVVITVIAFWFTAYENGYSLEVLGVSVRFSAQRYLLYTIAVWWCERTWIERERRRQTPHWRAAWWEVIRALIRYPGTFNKVDRREGRIQGIVEGAVGRKFPLFFPFGVAPRLVLIPHSLKNWPSVQCKIGPPEGLSVDDMDEKILGRIATNWRGIQDRLYLFTDGNWVEYGRMVVGFKAVEGVREHYPTLPDLAIFNARAPTSLEVAQYMEEQGIAPSPRAGS